MLKHSLLMMLVCLSGLTVAADPRVDIGEKFIQERLQKERIERQKRQSGVEIELQRRDAEVDELFGPCFDIHTITILGNEVLSTSKLDKITEEYLDKCLNKSLINRVLSDINNSYISRGYITTRAYLPQQDLSSGELKVTVVEGIVERIDINQNASADRRKLWFAMPISEEDKMQLRFVEQGVDQINRVSSGNAKLKLWPGEKPGGSRIEIISQPQNQVRGRLSFDNDGSSNTGRERLKLEFEVDNLLSVNDNWGLFLISSRDTNALAFNLGIPFRKWTFNYSASYSEFLNFLTEDSDLFGQSLTQTFSGDYLLVRGAKGQSKLTFAVNHRDSTRVITSSSELDSPNLADARIGFSQSYRSNIGFISFDIGYTQGLTLFSAQGDSPQTAFDAPRNEFKKADGSFLYSGVVAKKYQLTSSIRWQYSDFILPGSNQIHLGDRATVRGYRETPASGDFGAYWRNEVVMNWPKSWLTSDDNSHWYERIPKNSLAKTRPYMFLDGGSVRNTASDRNFSLAGAGFGLRYSHGRVAFDASWSWGLLSSPSDLRAGSEVYLSANITAF